MQKIAIGSIARQAHHAHELTHAVVFMHHVIADFQFGKRRYLFAAARAGSTLLAVYAVNIRFRYHGKPQFGIQESPIYREREDQHFARGQFIRGIFTD